MAFWGNLDLDLKRIAGIRIAPIVGVGEARGRGGGHHRARHVRHGQAELPGAVAIDRDIERGIAAFLRDLEVAQESQAGHPRADLQGVGVIVRETDALHGDLDGGGRTEAHHLADDVAGFE